MSEAIQFPETRAKAAEQLADRYMALWNEPDADRRRRMIAELWTQDGSQILQPPQEMREIAASPGIGLAATLEARGHCELQARATTSYEHWVGSEGLSFRARDVSGFAPPGDIHRVRNTADETALSIHVYGTDVTRVGSSARRYYD
jgi:hypothetical protein